MLFTHNFKNKIPIIIIQSKFPYKFYAEHNKDYENSSFKIQTKKIKHKINY